MTPGPTLALAGLLPDQIVENLSLEPAFRGTQIFGWIHRGAPDFSHMTDLPSELRARLAGSAAVATTAVARRHDAPDGSTKLRILLADGAFVETMCLADPNGRRTACLSTQSGCAMGCAFCRTGLMGLARDLEAHEIVEQFLHLAREAGSVDNVVFMGMGEPFRNWESTARAIEVLRHPEGTGMGVRRITVSTCGIPAGILRLAEEGPDVKLAVSLVTADQDSRASLMPVARAHPLAELKDALIAYQRARRHRITLEIVLLAGLTDRDRDADALLRFIPPLRAMVNLIPWNPVPEIGFSEPSRERVLRFEERLARAGVPVTRRVGKGRGILGACGQLAVLQDRADPADAR